LVERNQRERLIAAMAEVCGERGYAESSVAEVAKRAGVSTATFYDQFKDKRECLLASFEELFGRLLEAIEGACDGVDEPGERQRKAATFTAGVLAADLPTARLLSVEVIAVGAEGVAVQQRAIERVAALLRGAGEPPRIPDAAWTRAAAATALVAKRVGEERVPAAEELLALLEGI
jgi:AcrR family transcriptional regulator